VFSEKIICRDCKFCHLLDYFSTDYLFAYKQSAKTLPIALPFITKNAAA
jgi:hypothetical protein